MRYCFPIKKKVCVWKWGLIVKVIFTYIVSLRTGYVRYCSLILKKVCMWVWGLLVVGVSLEKTCPVFTPLTCHGALRPFFTLFLAGKSVLTS